MSGPAPRDYGGSLRVLVARGAAWTVGAAVMLQVLRLVSTGTITRFLLPDEFGLATPCAAAR
jgi:O-antigen/teichoic acid export membrane protein